MLPTPTRYYPFDLNAPHIISILDAEVEEEESERELDDEEYEEFLKCVQARSRVARNNIDVSLGLCVCLAVLMCM